MAKKQRKMLIRGGDRRTPRSARQAMESAQQQRRISDVQAPPPKIQRAIRAALKAGKRPQFPAAMTKTSRNAAMKYMRERMDGGKRINYREMVKKAVAAHSKAYPGQNPNRRASDRGGVERRTGGERRE